MLHLIQCYCGRDMALRIAKMFAIDMDRVQQSYFGTFTPAHTHGDQLVMMAQKKIEAGYTRTTTIEEIIQDLPASRRNVVRRFKHATGGNTNRISAEDQDRSCQKAAGTYRPECNGNYAEYGL